MARGRVRAEAPPVAARDRRDRVGVVSPAERSQWRFWPRWPPGLQFRDGGCAGSARSPRTSRALACPWTDSRGGPCRPGARVGLHSVLKGPVPGQRDPRSPRPRHSLPTSCAPPAGGPLDPAPVCRALGPGRAGGGTGRVCGWWPGWGQDSKVWAWR